MGAITVGMGAYDYLHPPVTDAAPDPLSPASTSRQFRDCLTGFRVILPAGTRATIDMEDVATGERVASQSVINDQKVSFNVNSNTTMPDGRPGFRGRIFNDAIPETKLDTLAACGERAVVEFGRSPGVPPITPPGIPTPINPFPPGPENPDININSNRVDVNASSVVITATNPFTGTGTTIEAGTADSGENFRRWWWLPASIITAGFLAGWWHVLGGGRETVVVRRPYPPGEAPSRAPGEPVPPRGPYPPERTARPVVVPEKGRRRWRWPWEKREAVDEETIRETEVQKTTGEKTAGVKTTEKTVRVEDTQKENADLKKDIQTKDIAVQNLEKQNQNQKKMIEETIVSKQDVQSKLDEKEEENRKLKATIDKLKKTPGSAAAKEPKVAKETAGKNAGKGAAGRGKEPAKTQTKAAGSTNKAVAQAGQTIEKAGEKISKAGEKIEKTEEKRTGGTRRRQGRGPA